MNNWQHLGKDRMTWNVVSAWNSEPSFLVFKNSLQKH